MDGRQKQRLTMSTRLLTVWIAPEAIWESMAHLHSPKQGAVRKSLLKVARTNCITWPIVSVDVTTSERRVQVW